MTVHERQWSLARRPKRPRARTRRPRAEKAELGQRLSKDTHRELTCGTHFEELRPRHCQLSSERAGGVIRGIDDARGGLRI